MGGGNAGMGGGMPGMPPGMNPQLGAMLQNPQMRAMLSNPQFLQGAMQMQSAMGGLGGAGNPFAGAGSGGPGGADAGLDFSSLLGGMGGSTPSGMPSMPIGGGAPTVPPVTAPATTYASQLTQLQDMGFG